MSEVKCVCGHSESHHYHVSGACMRPLGVHPANDGRCQCKGFRLPSEAPVEKLAPAEGVTLWTPTGKRIRGTSDTIPARGDFSTAEIDADGDIIPDYDGDTKVFWDLQAVDKNDNGEFLYLDEDGDTWAENELEIRGADGRVIRAGKPRV
jgi:hypothetical protein